MSDSDISTTKDNVKNAFLDASNGTIKSDDIEKITLSQNGQTKRRRRAAEIDVTITLTEDVNHTTATLAAAKEVEFTVVVGGVETKVTKTASVTETKFCYTDTSAVKLHIRELQAQWDAFRMAVLNSTARGTIKRAMRNDLKNQQKVFFATKRALRTRKRNAKAGKDCTETGSV